MDREAFSAFRDRHYAKIAEINDKKGADYAGDEDALANFKDAARQLGLRSEQIWAVYAHKHWSAIMAYCGKGKVESEPIKGRVHDLILYGFLLLGLIEDGELGRELEQRENAGQCLSHHTVGGHRVRCLREPGHNGYHVGQTPDGAVDW